MENKYAKEYSSEAMMVAVGSKEIKDGDICFVGLGLSQLPPFLAKFTHAPKITIVYELGVINPAPIDENVGVADPRAWYRTTAFTDTTEAMGYTLQKGRADVGVLGVWLVDKYGNLGYGPTMISGAGGANDFASHVKKLVLISRHSKRKFHSRVPIICCPGYIDGPGAREKAGIRGDFEEVLITSMGVFDFDDETKVMRVKSVHPGYTVEDVLAEMPFKPIVPDNVPITEPPTEEQIRIIREVLDPTHMYVK